MPEVLKIDTLQQNNAAPVHTGAVTSKAIRVAAAMSRRSAVLVGALGVGSMILAPQAFAAGKPKCIA